VRAVAEFLSPTIELASADIGAARHIADHRTRHQTLGDDRPLLVLGPAPPPFRSGDHLNSRHWHRLLHSCTGANTVIWTDTSNSAERTPQGKGALTGGLRSAGKASLEQRGIPRDARQSIDHSLLVGLT